MNLGYLLSKASRLCKQDLNLRLNELNLTVSQYIILRDISRYEALPEPEKHLNPACIAYRLNADRPTVTGIIGRLIEHGWVTKKANSFDKRSFYLVLTNKTIELMPTLDLLDAETLDKAFTGLNASEVNVLKEQLNRVIQNLCKGEETHE